MPSPHHHHQQCSCCCSCCCSSSSTPSPPPFSTSDQLLQALTTQLLQSQFQSPPYIYSHHYLKPHHPFYQPPHPTHQQPKDHHPQQQQQEQYPSQTHPLLDSLRRRVAALESSLPHLSSPSPPRPKSFPAPRPPSSPQAPRPSLRDAAARIIQARFRLFLVRRSQTLHYLKRLAYIKAQAAALRSSLSDQPTRRNPNGLSETATHLLLELDSIQSGDPMIREGKRSISRELHRILEFVDKVLAKERERSLGTAEILETGNEAFREAARIIEDDERLLRSSRPSKKVSFSDKGRVPVPEDFEERSNDGHRRSHVERSGREVSGIRTAEHSEPEEEVAPLSDDEGSSEGGCENVGKLRGQNGNLGGLSAPLPALMERSRRGK